MKDLNTDFIDKRTLRSFKRGNFWRITAPGKIQFSKKSNPLLGYSKITELLYLRYKKIIKTVKRL